MASKTAGQIAGGIGGAIIGSMVGDPVSGAIIGASLGYSAGTMIDPPDNAAGDMPPMASYPVQRSNKGTPITKVYGTVRVAGNILWMGSNHPWQTKKSSGGKGGGGSSVVTDSGNRRSFLIGICEGPVLVLRMWKGKEEIDLSNATFFRGDGSADTGINALTGEEFSNYPNTACAFFNEFEIGTGGTLPNFTFEVTDQFDPTKTQICTIEELVAINDLSGSSLDGDYELMNDLDLDIAPYNTGVGWPGIGFSLIPFTGTFDGRYHTISNMYQDTERVAHLLNGFFTRANEATISNLIVSDINIVSGPGNCGGFVGQHNNSTFTNCRVTGTMDDIISHCGGFAGRDGPSDFIRCSASVDQTRTNGSGVGLKGGFGGNIGDTFIDCYATGVIDSVVPVPVASTSIGGFVGDVAGIDTFTNCYAAVTIGYPAQAPPFDSIGGFMGNGDVGTVYDACYYDEDLNIGLPGIGDEGLPDPAEMNGKTTAQMQTQSTFEDDGWDFDTVWKIDEGSGYPTHQWVNLASTVDDANPAVIIKDLLTDPRYGAGIDESTWIDTASFTAAEEFCDANRLRFSFAIDRLRPVVDWIDFINSHFQGFFRMSEGKIQLHIYKEESSMFTITRDNLFIEKGEDPDPPVTVEKRLTSEIANRVEVTYTDRNATYDISVAIAMDESDQRASGKVKKKTLQLTGITNAKLAQKIAYRILFESNYRFSTYSFTLCYQDMLLEVGDVGTITDGFMLTDEKIRITKIEEIKDGKNLAIQAVEDTAFIYEEFEFLTQETERVPDGPPTLVDASATFTESITEGGFAISIVPGGADTNGWQIYKSYDDASYDFVGNAYIDDPAASPTNSTGTTTSSLSAHKTGPVYAGQESINVNIGTVTVLDTAVTDTQFFNNKRLCKIGDEILAYKTCVQTAVEGIWKITGLIRGLFGTEPVAHTSGEVFWTINVDFTFAFADSDIGQTIYFKFLTLFGSSIQNLSDVTGIPYLVLGNYKRPMPVGLMRIQDHEGQTTYETDDVVISFYLASKTAGFNLGGHGDVLWGAYETDPSITTLDVTLKEVDETEILNEVFDISEIGEPMAVFIADADRDGNNPYIIEMIPGALYSGIGSRELELEKV